MATTCSQNAEPVSRNGWVSSHPAQFTTARTWQRVGNRRHQVVDGTRQGEVGIESYRPSDRASKGIGAAAIAIVYRHGVLGAGHQDDGHGSTDT